MPLFTFEIDPHRILGVTPQATLAEIRDAYRQKAKVHHPDAGGEDWAFRIVVQAAGLLVAPATTHTAYAQVPDPSDTGAPGEEGKGSGRPFDGYIATIALLMLVLFIVGKSARR